MSSRNRALLLFVVAIAFAAALGAKCAAPAPPLPHDVITSIAPPPEVSSPAHAVVAEGAVVFAILPVPSSPPEAALDAPVQRPPVCASTAPLYRRPPPAIS